MSESKRGRHISYAQNQEIVRALEEAANEAKRVMGASGRIAPPPGESSDTNPALIEIVDEPGEQTA